MMVRTTYEFDFTAHDEMEMADFWALYRLIQRIAPDYGYEAKKDGDTFRLKITEVDAP